jgi:hypothetical protein
MGQLLVRAKVMLTEFVIGLCLKGMYNSELMERSSKHKR